MTEQEFAASILRWHTQHGRKTLPWQKNISPYSVWVSEIMLQQTQVSAVMDYYSRFMQRFATIQALAQAPLDEVLHLWTGLGYYSRARNLHKTAHIITQQYGGQFPRCVKTLASLPGIGRSTAGAIASLSMQIRAPILDGNVKRVLARYSAQLEYPGLSRISKQLWQLAEQLTPDKQVVGCYNQAMMDLGATVCIRRQPQCHGCPVRPGCQAFARQLQHQLPAPRPHKTLPQRDSLMLLIADTDDQVLLYQRPANQFWGGLYALPELTDIRQLEYFLSQKKLKCVGKQPMNGLNHTFSHFKLRIQPWLVRVRKQPAEVAESPWFWYNTRQPQAIGLPAPIKNLLQQPFTVPFDACTPD